MMTLAVFCFASLFLLSRINGKVANGTLNANEMKRLYNGKELEPGQRADFFVRVLLIKDEQPGIPERLVHRCGGVLISEKHVLTAAHCVYIDKKDKKYYRHYHIQLWLFDFTHRTNRHHIDTTRRFWPHEKYLVKDYNKMYDIALIEPRTVQRPANEAIRLCRKNEKKKSPHTYRVFGMGSTSWDVTKPVYPSVVLYADMQDAVHTQKECGSLNPDPSKSELQICLKGQVNQVDLGLGDSGNPAVLHEGNRECLYGIATSLLHHPLVRMSGAVFARVSYFKEWIDQTKGTLGLLAENEMIEYPDPNFSLHPQ